MKECKSTTSSNILTLSKTENDYHYNDRKLLCTFTNQELLNETISEIISSYCIYQNRIFILRNEDDDNEAICTYNITIIDNDCDKLKNTIVVNRNKNTNTLYTIDAVNELVRTQNNGILDPHFKISWGRYWYTLLNTDKNGLIIRRTKLQNIIELDQAA
jgi:hypothetical protein